MRGSCFSGSPLREGQREARTLLAGSAPVSAGHGAGGLWHSSMHEMTAVTIAVIIITYCDLAIICLANHHWFPLLTQASRMTMKDKMTMGDNTDGMATPCPSLPALHLL